mgnify:CR=1 FL=1
MNLVRTSIDIDRMVLHPSGLEKSIKKLMRTVALVLFFLVSFATGAWVVTWLIFPIEKALEGVVCAALDLKGED